MRLRITTPLTVVVDETNVQIVSAEDASGGFGIQPHYAEFPTSLAVGVVSWKDGAGARHYCAVHGGVLTVTGGQVVAITTREAIPGDDLVTLDQQPHITFKVDPSLIAGIELHGQHFALSNS